MTLTPRQKLISGLFLLLAFFLESHFALAATTPYQNVKVQNRQLLVDFDRDGNYTPYLIKGVAYSPTPIGRYSDDWGYPSPSDPRPKNLYDDPAVLNRDFALLKAMNANAVRFWKGNNTQVTFADTQNPRSPWYLHYADITRFPNYLTSQTFDLAETYGLKIIAGFEMPWPGSWQCDQNASAARYQISVDFNDPYLRSDIINRFRAYVLEFKDHPALLFWAIGNENNLGFNEQTPQGKAQSIAFYSLIQEMAQEARLIEGAFYHPVAIVNGDIQNIGNSELGTSDADLSGIDIWGANVYRGVGFTDLFQNFSVRSGKAFWLSEYGEDAWQVTDVNNPADGREDQALQATRNGALWQEIKDAYLNQQSIGGTVMNYSDEWWKPYTWLCEIDNDPTTTANGPGGCNLVQNYYGFGPQDNSCPRDGVIDWNPPAADHFFNEEWWGIMAIAKDARLGYPDIMLPRQVYTTFQQLFQEDTNPPTVVISSPENNAVVLGTDVIFSVNAADNIGVTGVQFQLDGNNLGDEDITAPYSMVWDTTSVSDGIHTLTAIARDAEGNLGTASATVTVANTALPAPVLASAVGGDAQVILNWNNTVAATGYTVKYGNSSGIYWDFIDLPAVNTATISGLINGATYYFIVVAKYGGDLAQESNELSAILSAPDFEITALSSLNDVKIGNPLIVNSTVKNNSTARGAIFLTSYYLSYDENITTSDVLLGTRVIPALSGGASSSAATTFTVPSNIAPASYYLGAIADYTNFRTEQNENNNSFLGNSVNVSAGADLIISVISGPAAILPGQIVNLTDTEKNQGTASVGANYVSYYLSTDSTITDSDILIGNRYVGGLAAGASIVGGITLTIPSTLALGTYYWGAIADSTFSHPEADENNNATSGNSVVLSTSADLTMTAFVGPAHASGGQTVTLTDSVKNQGLMPIGAHYVGYYFSEDDVITTSDIFVGNRYVASLAAGASLNGNVNVTIPSDIRARTYYWGAIADHTQSQTEADESNNSILGSTVIVTPGADLKMVGVNGPASGSTNQVVTVSDTVQNQGTSAIGAYYVGYYLSADPQITIADTRLGARYIPGLAVGASSSGNFSVAIPSSLPGGTYYWGAIADFTQTQPESDESNNAIAGNAIVVTPGADLTMTAMNGPAIGATGQVVTISDTIKNQGTSAIGGHYVGYYLSADPVITANDLRLGARFVQNLAAGASSSGNVSFGIPVNLMPGTYYWGVIADFTQTQSESNENNNALVGNTILIHAGGDLVMTNVNGPSEMINGESVTIAMTVKNQGIAVIGASYVGVYLSSDPEITTSDIRLGARYIPSLAVGVSSTGSVAVTIPTSLPTGTYYWGAIADFTQTQREADDSNNSLTGNVATIHF